jgi:hypothetical protein
MPASPRVSVSVSKSVSVSEAVGGKPPQPTTAFVISPPDTPPETWLGDDFWRWFQHKRQEAGFLAERGPPKDVGKWFSVAMQTVNGDVESLQEAVYRYGNDKHWQTRTPALPWAGFISQWTNFVPRGVAHAAT